MEVDTNEGEESLATPVYHRRASNRSASLTWEKALFSPRYDESYGLFQEAHSDFDESLSSAEMEERLGATGVPSIPSKELLDMADPLCPGWIDTISPGKHVRLYAFVVNTSSRILLRSPSQFKAEFDVRSAVQYVQRTSSPRISSAEETRRVLGYVYADAMATQAGTVRQWVSKQAEVDGSFLKRRDIEVVDTMSQRPEKKSGYMARALSERHWKEEYVRLFDNHMAFFHPERTRPHFRIYLNAVMRLRRLDETECPAFPGFAFLEVETLGRTEYLMFSAAHERNSWERALNDGVLAIKQASYNSPLEGIDDPTEQFLHKSSSWDCHQRRILNCRRFYFNAPTQEMDPASVVEEALLMAYEAQETDDQESLFEFLDCAAALKNVDVYGMQEKQRLAFFMNLYHLMIMHSYLLLGPPETSFKLDHMNQMVSYQTSDDIFTIAELEHNIIRAAMGYPSQFGAKLSLPKSQFGFALKVPDFRINFALNCGSLASPENVPIYKGEIVDYQLDSTAILFLDTVKMEFGDNDELIVTLPQVCQWYMDDFGVDDDVRLLEKVETFLSDEQKSILKSLEQQDPHAMVVVRYDPFLYECRTLVLEGQRTRGRTGRSFEEIDPFADSDFVEEEDLESIETGDDLEMQ